MDKYAAWPPTTLGPSFPSSQVALLPTLTRTGTPITLATPSPSVTGAGNGWADSADTAGAYTTVAGCQYAGAYMGTDIPVPTAVCTGA